MVKRNKPLCCGEGAQAEVDRQGEGQVEMGWFELFSLLKLGHLDTPCVSPQ